MLQVEMLRKYVDSYQPRVNPSEQVCDMYHCFHHRKILVHRPVVCLRNKIRGPDVPA
jgi:hypothetical protein